MNMPARDVFLYDTTLRDGSQGRGISFSVADKIRIAHLLDQFGVSYIEAGWPGSNPKDCEFFRSVKEHPLSQATLVAFGSTRRKQSTAESDLNLQALIAAATPAVAIFGKSWLLHVTEVLGALPNENLTMIEDSVRFLREQNREVIYDAEHFFDGYRADRSYALETLHAAARGGASWLVLCDTNGGSLPHGISAACSDVMAQVIEPLRQQGVTVSLGIHAHNDGDLAVANSLAAVSAGARQVQGTINGYGERCGNANLVSIAANLELKLGQHCVDRGKLSSLTELAHRISDIANIGLPAGAPFVGLNAFAHKGGVHVAAVEKTALSYEHITPECVGNEREILISELSGRGNIRLAARESELSLEGMETTVLERIKELEAKGFQFEDADASFELLLHKAQPSYIAPFELLEAMVVSERREGGRLTVQAMTKLKIESHIVHTAAEAEGPVDALDKALRKALAPHFPAINKIHLTDYKVRILDPQLAASATTRVMIEAASGESNWRTVGCSQNLVDASLQALLESFEFHILRHGSQDEGNRSRGATV